ncbi:hypothetical protein BC830DRAFT_1169470 [Chytriomyces sp. MP71]|nr:hypothetical protein BC830DRAFT_1169470 [Chytriomyces sp. MP71]
MRGITKDSLRAVLQHVQSTCQQHTTPEKIQKAAAITAGLYALLTVAWNVTSTAALDDYMQDLLVQELEETKAKESSPLGCDAWAYSDPGNPANPSPIDDPAFVPSQQCDTSVVKPILTPNKKKAAQAPAPRRRVRRAPKRILVYLRPGPASAPLPAPHKEPHAPAQELPPTLTTPVLGVPAVIKTVAFPSATQESIQIAVKRAKGHMEGHLPAAYALIVALLALLGFVALVGHHGVGGLEVAVGMLLERVREAESGGCVAQCLGKLEAAH